MSEKTIFKNKYVWIQFQKLSTPKCFEFSLWTKIENSNLLYEYKNSFKIPLNYDAYKLIKQCKKLYKEDK